MNETSSTPEPDATLESGSTPKQSNWPVLGRVIYRLLVLLFLITITDLLIDMVNNTAVISNYLEGERFLGIPIDGVPVHVTNMPSEPFDVRTR